MPCSSPQDGMHAIVAQGGSQSKLIHFAYITPIGPTKIRQLVAASKLMLKRYLKKENKQTKSIFSTDILLPFKKNKSNFGQRKLTLAIFHLSHFLPLSLRPKMSLTISLPCPGGTDLSPKCARLHGGSDAKKHSAASLLPLPWLKPSDPWVFTGNVGNGVQ